jgi:hypothetical protein
MTQPPDEPREGRPDEEWQPPTPPPPGQYPGFGPPYDRPPPGQNPYGGETMSYYGPTTSGGMSRSLKVVLGVVIGLFGGIFLWFVALVGFVGTTSSGDQILFFAALAPLVVPAPLLIWKATRPWAAGLLVGTALASIGLSSLCSAMISSFEGGA